MDKTLFQSKQIWRAYTYKCEMSFKTRNGTIACGVVPPLKLTDVYARPEFVAEHEGRSAFLLSVAYEWYPNLADDREKLATVQFMLMHDGGERKGGDKLDDGSRSHEEARTLEEATMRELFSCFPEERQFELNRRYRDFEDYADEMSFAKAMDKAEAVLWQIFLYKQGHVGYVTWKNPPSGRDLRFGKILGTYRAIDIWCLHYRVATKHCPWQSGTWLVNDVLRAAFLDVMGEIPYCMTIDVTDIPLDIPEDETYAEILEFPEDRFERGLA